MSRQEWTEQQKECSKYARLEAVEASRKGIIATEEDLYSQCMKKALGSPMTIGDLRSKK